MPSSVECQISRMSEVPFLVCLGASRLVPSLITVDLAPSSSVGLAWLAPFSSLHRLTLTSVTDHSGDCITLSILSADLLALDPRLIGIALSILECAH